MGIKPNVAIIATLLLTAAAVQAAEGDFGKSLTPEESNSAGLSKLTPDELARLDALVERYRSGPATLPQKKEAEVPEAGATKTKKALPEWIGALITLQHSAGKPEKSDALESQLVGDFSGWRGRTTFRLENGQLWAQANSDSYVYSPTLKSPKVKIYPASFNSFWMQIEGVNQRCRVKPLKLD